MRKEYAQVSAKTEQAKGKKGFAHPTEGYKAEVSHKIEDKMGK